MHIVRTLSNQVVNCMVYECLRLFLSDVNSVEGNFDMRHPLTSMLVLARQFVQGLGEQELFIVLFWLDAHSPFFKLLNVSVDLGNCLFHCAFILHQYIQHLSTHPLRNLAAVTLNQVDTLVLHLKLGLHLLKQHFIHVLQLHCHVLLLH